MKSSFLKNKKLHRDQLGPKLKKAEFNTIFNIVPRWHKVNLSILLHIIFHFPPIWRKVKFNIISFYIISTARGVAQR